MSKESFELCMKRLFVSLNPRADYKSINRLDLFEILFNDRQKVIEKQARIIELLKESNEFYGDKNTWMASAVSIPSEIRIISSDHYIGCNTERYGDIEYGGKKAR